jgi:nuclear pore complex protein Nup93
MERVYREVDDYIEQTLGIDFEEQKTRIMKHLGLISEDDERQSDPASSARGFGRSSRGTPSLSRSVFGRSALNKSIIGTPGTLSGTSSFFKGETPNNFGTLLRGQSARDLRDKERLFVEQVQSLNLARLRGEFWPVMNKFGEVEKTASIDSPLQLADSYAALQEIVNEASSPSERQYSALYLDKTRMPTQLSRQIIDGSRKYLEKTFFREVESQVERNPRDAQLGGRPTVINKVRAYIRVRVARKNLAPDGTELQQIGDNGDYCWILIFILLRCGFVKEAAEYVNNDAAFQSTDRRFVSYLSTYANSPDRRLSRKLQEMIDGEYQQRAKLAPKGTVDPYRMACYKVVGRCDLTSRNLDTVGQGVEDWLWLQFVLARQQLRDEEVTGELFGLEQIQETIAEIGEKHFQKAQIEASGYGTFFMMQILAGMFEQAVDYLHAFNPVSAVHFAIALSFYALLRVSDLNAGNELCKS